jgi:hypothetical protein
MNVRLAVTLIILAIFSAAVAASFNAKPAEAVTIICNPQPTPHLIGWGRNRKVNRT